MNSFYYIPIIFFLLLACDRPVREKPLPNTPESVAQKWLEDYYNNRFEAAKKLSTAATKEMIDIISEVADAETENVMAFNITDLICTTTADSSRCQFLFNEGDMETEDEIILKRIGNQWLVDESYRSGDGQYEGGELDTIYNNLDEVIEEAIDRE